MIVAATTKLTSKFQITIPLAVRRKLGLQAGDVLCWDVQNGQATLRVLHGGWVQAAVGLGAEVWRQEGGVAAIAAERESWK